MQKIKTRTHSYPVDLRVSTGKHENIITKGMDVLLFLGYSATNVLENKWKSTYFFRGIIGYLYNHHAHT